LSGSHDTSRISAFDGLRGWAALSVVISHCLLEAFKYKFPAVVTFPATFIANGTFAVAIFFTISGYVLTIRRWHNPANPPLYVAFVRRYIRLTIPIIGATFLAWALISLGQTPTKAHHDLAQIGEWFGFFINFKADFFRAWFFALFGAYGFLWQNNYNPFLWTMGVELWGALIIFATSQHDRFLRDRYMPLLFFAVLTDFIFPIAACFFVGALIALAERDGFVLKPGVVLNRIAAGVLAVCLVLAALVTLNGKSLQLLALLGVGVFLSARYSPSAQSLLNSPVSQFMGRISFPLYLVQFPVIASFSAQLIVWTDSNGTLTMWTAYGIAVASTAVCVLVATLFLPIETGTFALLRRIDRYRTSRAPALNAKAEA
jgi:peptidoglycan/LPS O-acetylase OafA/YrhL